jgi:hypothetical protein
MSSDPHDQAFTFTHAPDIKGVSAVTGPGPWQPLGDLVSHPAADQSYETGPRPSFGPTPVNIHGGELQRAADDLDGDAEPQEDPYDQITPDWDDDTDDDTGPVADNICCDQRGFHSSAHGVHLNLGTLGR